MFITISPFTAENFKQLYKFTRQFSKSFQVKWNRFYSISSSEQGLPYFKSIFLNNKKIRILAQIYEKNFNLN